MQLLIVVIGLILFFNPSTLLDPIHLGSAPTWSDLVFAMTVAVISFTSLESAAGLAGEVRIGRRGLKHMVGSGAATVIFGYVGIALVAITALPVHDGHTALAGRYLNDPVIGIVTQVHPHWLAHTLRYVVGALATLTLIAAANSAMLGLSRLAYSLSTNRQIPSGLGRLHPQRSTPYVLIVLAGLLAAVLVVPENLDFLVGIYAFGAMLAFTIAHLSICRLRYSEPDRDRPYKVPLSLRVRGGELPLPAVFGALVCAAGWVAVMILHEPARYVGLGWMAFGIAVYVVYRRADETSLTARVTVSPQILRAEPPSERDYGSILVPLFGTKLDEDIVQTAALLAAGEPTEDSETEDRDGDDRGRLDLCDADVAAARRAPAGGAGQARPPGAGAGEGGGGGVRGRIRRHGDRAHAARGVRDRGGGAPPRASKRSCSGRRNPPGFAAARAWADGAGRWRTSSARSPSTS